MDRIGARKLRNANDFRNRQITLDRPHILCQMRPAPDLIALVRLETMQRKLVLFRPDRHRFYSKLIGRTEYADRYL